MPSGFAQFCRIRDHKQCFVYFQVSIASRWNKFNFRFRYSNIDNCSNLTFRCWISNVTDCTNSTTEKSSIPKLFIRFCLFCFSTARVLRFSFFLIKTRILDDVKLMAGCLGGWLVCTLLSFFAYIWFYLKAAHLYVKASYIFYNKKTVQIIMWKDALLYNRIVHTVGANMYA